MTTEEKAKLIREKRDDLVATYKKLYKRSETSSMIIVYVNEEDEDASLYSFAQGTISNLAISLVQSAMTNKDGTKGGLKDVMDLATKYHFKAVLFGNALD